MNRVTVERKDRDSIQQMLKVFKRKMNQSGHIKEVFDRKFYDKPSAVKRKQLKDAKRQNTKYRQD